MYNLDELYIGINHLFKKDVEVSVLLDYNDIVYYNVGTEDSVEYDRKFYNRLYDACGPLVVHTHINTSALPSIYDLTAWCSNEEILTTAIFALNGSKVDGFMFEKTNDYTSPSAVFHVWEEYIKDGYSQEDAITSTMKELKIYIVDTFKEE